MIDVMRIGNMVVRWLVIGLYCLTIMACCLATLAGSLTGDYGDLWKLAGATVCAVLVEIGWRVSVYLRKLAERL